MRELRIPTRKTNPIHNDVPENTTFLLLDQPSGEANTTGTLISKINEVAINAKTANWKAIVMFLILQSTNKRILYIPFDLFIIISQKNASWKDFTMNLSLIPYDLLPPLVLYSGTESRVFFFLFTLTKQGACLLSHAMHLYYIYIDIYK